MKKALFSLVVMLGIFASCSKDDAIQDESALALETKAAATYEVALVEGETHQGLPYIYIGNAEFQNTSLKWKVYEVNNGVRRDVTAQAIVTECYFYGADQYFKCHPTPSCCHFPLHDNTIHVEIPKENYWGFMMDYPGGDFSSTVMIRINSVDLFARFNVYKTHFWM